MRESWLTREWCGGLADLVMPMECAGCGRPGAVLCGGCLEPLCGRGARRVRPDPAPRGLPPVYASAGYWEPVRAVLLAHKERGALALTRPLGQALALAVREAVRERPGEKGRVLLVPVPSARRSVAARGHDPTRRIALAAASRLRRDGLPVRVAAVLAQRREVRDQSGLDARARLSNVAGAFEARAAGSVAGSPVVLVDDLLTTGASLVEAARAVRRARGRVIGAAVVAAAYYPVARARAEGRKEGPENARPRRSGGHPCRSEQ
ncbi:ComF family protein [Wenjunlia tyrosinilytica]|uniref:Phosphoribosyltransferase domain-containing protein n=1 Tax=Wenjunlia tyrosinilytica TaxID=1544741 RepID=A0A918E034_9ACTN|nr:phosphoribosyltransferase family protein [Wenjunlia tyrosinilytica]GGO97345.1 hypothetical protein GCM10012280_58950 [Wenjunlia tyrosinilytica]